MINFNHDHVNSFLNTVGIDLNTIIRIFTMLRINSIASQVNLLKWRDISYLYFEKLTHVQIKQLTRVVHCLAPILTQIYFIFFLKTSQNIRMHKLHKIVNIARKCSIWGNKGQTKYFFYKWQNTTTDSIMKWTHSG